MSSRALFVVAVVAAVLLAGCSDSVPTQSPSAGGLTIAKYVELATASGADPQQIEVLERARDRGEITFEDLSELAELTKQCLEDAGFDVIDKEPVEVVPGSGLRTPYYLSIQPYGMSDEVAGEVMDDCSMRFDNWAGAAFADQPLVVEAYNSQWDTPEVRACLEDHGYQVDDEMTGTELNQLAGEDLNANADAPGFRPCIPDFG